MVLKELQRQAPLLHLVPTPLIVRDPTGVIQLWNPAAERLYGWTSTEARGRVVHSLLQTRFADSLEAVNAALLSEGVWEGELRHTCRDGTEVIVASRQALQRDASDRPVVILEINSDVTRGKRVDDGFGDSTSDATRTSTGLPSSSSDVAERKLLEDELRRSIENLEQAARENARLYSVAQQAVIARDEFLAATSHELRTPLAHVKGFVSTLRQTDAVFDETQRADFLAEVEREADRLSELIGVLLDWSRIASGGLTDEGRVAAQLDSLIAGGLARIRGTVSEHQVRVAVSDSLPCICVCASQIERVVAILVDNAAKYSSPCSPITISGDFADRVLVLRVEDEGPGIPPADLDNVFEPYFRMRPADMLGTPGTGLGLAVCRGIVEAHGGHIHAENRPAVGSAFVVTLPVG